MDIYIERFIEPDIKSCLGKPKVLILKGARQTGKTTLLKKIKSDLEIKKQKTLFFSIDLEINNPLFQDPKLLISFLERQAADRFLYLFLDEFQHIKQAGLFLKVVFDQLKDKVQIIVSGSSSLEITKNTEFLTGRKIEFYLSTLQFREFLPANFPTKESFLWEEPDQIREFDLIYREELKNKLAEFIYFGSYPEIATTREVKFKKILLKELISSYLQKDIAGFLKIEKVKEFNALSKILADQIGNLVNKNELRTTVNLDSATLNKYLATLENTYVFDFLKPYYQNIRKELRKMNKVFINDFGMRNVLLDKGSENNFFYDDIRGEEAENFVYLELKQKISPGNPYFYRTISKAEIDFIIFREEKFIPLEVKFRNKVSRNIPLVMKNFSSKYSVDYFVVITKNFFSLDQKEKKLFLPIYLWPFFKV